MTDCLEQEEKISKSMLLHAALRILTATQKRLREPRKQPVPETPFQTSMPIPPVPQSRIRGNPRIS